MGRSLLARWQNLLLPPEAFNVGEFVGHLQQDDVPHSALTMFHLLYQPTARDPDRPPALAVMENTLPLFTPISFAALAAPTRALCFQSLPCRRAIALPPKWEVML